jgi:histidinol-phosphate aminotransferase
MYEVAAALNDVAVKRANLTRDFALDAEAVAASIDLNTKLIFFCSPNNPTGNLVSSDEILKIAGSFRGLVVVDEAYIHFSDHDSHISDIDRFPNLVALQTFSKAWGLAGLRVGAAYSSREVIGLMNKIKLPYNVSQVAQDMILKALEDPQALPETIAQIKQERSRLAEALKRLSFVERVYPSEANFLLVKMQNADGIYRFLVDQQIVVRNRGSLVLCDDCLRITVGTPYENECLLSALAECQSEGKLNA